MRARFRAQREIPARAAGDRPQSSAAMRAPQLIQAAVVVAVAVTIGFTIACLSSHPDKHPLTNTQFSSLGTLIGLAYKDTAALSLGLTGSCKTEGCLEKRRVALDKTFAKLAIVLAAGNRYGGDCGSSRYEARTVVIDTQRLLNPMLAAVYRKQAQEANTLAGQFKTSWARFDKDAQAVHDNCAPAR
jgi:hypothetical protein